MVLLEIDSGHLRVGLRVYFIGLFAILGLVGNECCKCAAKLDLIHGRPVRLHKLTGWVRPRDVVMCIWQLRRLPGGWWLGLMMILASILTFVADLSVALLVKDRDLPGNCLFSQGLVMNYTNDSFDEPPQNGYPAKVARNAQDISFENGCDVGIYYKIPSDIGTDFCPSDEEILGTWECNDVLQDVTIPPEYTTTDIAMYLYNRSLQYDPWPLTTSIGEDGTNFSSQYIAWSSSIGNGTNSTFDVLASVDLNVNNQDSKTIRTYHCAIASNVTSNLDHMESILQGMNSYLTLSLWVQSLDGEVFLGTISNSSLAAEYTEENAAYGLVAALNTLTMVQGGNNDPFQTLPGTNFYGCVVTRTTISPFVFLLVAITGMVLCVTFSYWIYLLICIGFHALPGGSRRKDVGPRNIRPVPDSILSWMLQASREQTAGHGAMERYDQAGLPTRQIELRDWSFVVTDPEKGVARMSRTNNEVAPPIVQSHYTLYQIDNQAMTTEIR